MSVDEMNSRVEGELKVRTYKSSDFESVARIERYSFKSPWAGGLFKRMAERNPEGFKVAVLESNVIGYVIGRVETKNSQELGHLMNLAVDEEYRRIGVGSSLLEEIEDYFCEKKVDGAWLEVREGNMSALDFYLKNGYEYADFEKDYYSDGANAIIMYKKI